LPAKLVKPVVTRVPAIDQETAARRVIETKQKGDEGGFAGAAGADERDSLSGSGSEVDPVKNFDPLPRRVAEADILKHDIASQSRQAGGRRGAEENLHFTRFAEEFPHSLGGSDGFLKLAV
jgi:hypothetical protein